MGKNEMNNMKKLLVLKTTTLRDVDEYVVIINEMNAVVVNVVNVVNVVIFVNVNQSFRFYYHYVKKH